MIIGCASLIMHDSRIVALKCGKGRGIILPGGKWESGETFYEAAARELREETGLIAKRQKFLFAGPSGDGSITYAFETEIEEFNPISSKEGEVVLATWNDLLASAFKAYYHLLRTEFFSPDVE